MTARGLTRLEKDLVRAGLRLAEEHPEVTPGSVLRCFARAVRLTRRTGSPTPSLVPRAERLARQMLVERGLAPRPA